MSRLTSLTPSRAGGSPRNTPSPTSSPTPEPPLPTETTYHRKLKLIIVEIKNVFKIWDELVLIDGMKAGKGCVDEATEMDNILEVPESPERPPVGPHLRALYDHQGNLQAVMTKLEKLLVRLSALIDQAENLFFDAYRVQGADLSLNEPLWFSWTFEHFVNTLSPLLSLHNHHYYLLMAIADILLDTETPFDDAKVELEHWRDLGRGGERFDSVREWEELVELELTGGGVLVEEEDSLKKRRSKRS